MISLLINRIRNPNSEIPNRKPEIETSEARDRRLGKRVNECEDADAGSLPTAA